MMQVMWIMKREFVITFGETDSVLATPEELALWMEHKFKRS